MDTKLMARFAIRETMGLVLMGVILFWAAGRINWWPAWALIAVMLAWVTATATVILRFHPALLAERLGLRKGAKSWDTAILGFIGIAQIAALIVVGLDQRYGWTGGLPLAAQIAALTLCALGYALVVWATAANAFFLQAFRIQTERGHTVATGGTYRLVRHPAYVGTILSALAAPILLASWWALIPGSLHAAVMVLRTMLEDRALWQELDGYERYAQSTRYRLVPGVW